MRRLLLIALSTLLLAVLCSCELSCDPPAQGKMHIFVYGNDYTYGSSVYYEDGTKVQGSANPLKGTVNDALQVGLALCNLAKSQQDLDYDAVFMIGVESKSVTDPKATVINDVSRTAFLSAMDTIAHKASENDITIIYYSGHGLGGETKLPYGSDPASESYLALRRDSSSTILYSIAKFLSEVEKIPGTKVILGDFCHSGALVKAGNVSVTAGEYSNISATKLLKYRDNITESSSVYCLSAARYYEKSWEPGGGEHGYFTKALLKGLGWDEESQSLVTPDAMKDKRITLFNLAKYITSNDGNAKQTPMTSGGSNDIILFSF